MPDFLAGRLNWLPPGPPRKQVCPPHRIQVRGGGGWVNTLACGKVLGEPIQTKGQAPWYNIMEKFQVLEIFLEREGTYTSSFPPHEITWMERGPKYSHQTADYLNRELLGSRDF